MKMHTAKSFMAETGGVGLISRIFSPNEEGLNERVEQFGSFLNEILSKKIGNNDLVRRVDVIIPSNRDRYAKLADCGKTAGELRRYIGASTKIRIHELTSGDMFCAMQNYAIAEQAHTCAWHIISSSETLPYWQGDAGQFVAESLVEAACKGARATGAAVNPIAESVMQGHIANTLMMWHGKSLQEVGGFNLLAAQQMDGGPGSRILYGIKEDSGFATTPVHGVEETLPEAFLTLQYGQCLAPFDVPFGNLAYTPVSQDDRTKAWNAGKFDTKRPRQAALLAAGGFGVDFLASGVMEGYGWRS